MQVWLNELASNAGATALLTSAVAFIAAITAALTSLLVSRRSLYINSVTAQRSKWINELRSNISKFAATVGHLYHEFGQLKGKQITDEVDQLIKESLSWQPI